MIFDLCCFDWGYGVFWWRFDILFDFSCIWSFLMFWVGDFWFGVFLVIFKVGLGFLGFDYSIVRSAFGVFFRYRVETLVLNFLRIIFSKR